LGRFRPPHLKPEPELDNLSNILSTLNEQFGNIDRKDADKIQQVMAEEIPAKVSADKAFQNAMKNSHRQNARIGKNFFYTLHL
jgi:type I restriction enzyme, R subunit